MSEDSKMLDRHTEIKLILDLFYDCPITPASAQKIYELEQELDEIERCLEERGEQ
jgi:hypothetical protein